MNKLEKNLSAKFKKVWPYYFERIEPKYKGGIPDVLLAMNYNSFPLFVELKIGHMTYDSKKQIGRVNIKIEGSQKLWHRKYPGRSYLLIDIGGAYFLVHKSQLPKIKNGMPLFVFDKLSAFTSTDLKKICWYLEGRMTTSF